MLEAEPEVMLEEAPEVLSEDMGMANPAPFLHHSGPYGRACDGFLDLTATVNGKRLKMWNICKPGSFRAGNNEFQLFSPPEEDEIDLQSVWEVIKASKISTWTSPSLLGQTENNIEATESPPSKKQKPQDLSREQGKVARRFVADVTCVALCMMGSYHASFRVTSEPFRGHPPKRCKISETMTAASLTIKGIEAWLMGLSDKPYTQKVILGIQSKTLSATRESIVVPRESSTAAHFDFI